MRFFVLGNATKPGVTEEAQRLRPRLRTQPDQESHASARVGALRLGRVGQRGHERRNQRLERRHQLAAGGRRRRILRADYISRTPNPRRACSFESFIRSRPASLTAARSAAAAISPVRRPPE